MNIEAAKDASVHLRELHTEARRVLYSDGDATQTLARLALVLGEMYEPLNQMREAFGAMTQALQPKQVSE